MGASLTMNITIYSFDSSNFPWNNQDSNDSLFWNWVEITQFLILSPTGALSAGSIARQAPRSTAKIFCKLA